MKKYILGLITGILLTGTLVFATNHFLASDIKYKDKTVEEALNDLYNRKSVATMDLTVFDSLKLPTGQFNYVSEDSSIISVDSDNNFNALKEGKVIVNAYINDKLMFKYNVTSIPNPFSILQPGSRYNSYSAYISSSTEEDNEKLKGYLTDGVVSKQGTYGALLLGGSVKRYVYFNLSSDAYINFSSNQYSDSSGGSGATVNFYSIDSEENKTLYYSLKQENNKAHYGEYLFKAGRYYLVTIPETSTSGTSYAEFDEWTITPVN